MDDIKKLIVQLINTAKAQGISQKKLAELAGMSDVGLSKAKKRGDISASRLSALAAPLDLELTLVPARKKEKAIAAVRSGTLFAGLSEPDT